MKRKPRKNEVYIKLPGGGLELPRAYKMINTKHSFEDSVGERSTDNSLVLCNCTFRETAGLVIQADAVLTEDFRIFLHGVADDCGNTFPAKYRYNPHFNSSFIVIICRYASFVNMRLLHFPRIYVFR